MQNEESEKLIDIWKNELTSKITKNSPFEIPEQLKQFSQMFSLGPFYYYVLNFYNLSMEYVHNTTQDLLGISAETFTLEKLLSKLPEEELKFVQQKETLATDFLNNQISKSDIPNYKVVYYFRAYNEDGELRTFLHQAITIKQSKDGNLERVLGIHVDVTDFKIVKNNLVSFISLSDCPSYYNIDPTKLPYSYSDKMSNSSLKRLFSARELEIVRLLSKGYTSKEIGKHLFISINTVSTHRKNILKKTGAKNTVELIKKYLVEGLV